ncbi:hypothetical protein [Streptomyces sp. NPDC050428]|uniref:hypothetical protein n=1 Tax=Streptomyces sp. NPDC050428 TaxID=3155757 RepID=UPI003429CEEF
MSAVLIVTGLVVMAAGIVAYRNAERIVDAVDGWVIGTIRREGETERRAWFDKRIAAERNPARHVAWRTIRDREMP